MTRKKLPDIIEPTPEEDARIRDAIASDPDTREWTADDFARARRGPPWGRPRGHTKEQITLRIDKDVLAHFRDSGKGWQTRINAALRRAAGL
ncbi:MAG: BrnA antitoxin family protein [Sphingomonadales bacterium]|nr:BrnA antitoxin family protein [Sphingomonadales bacterium]